MLNEAASREGHIAILASPVHAEAREAAAIVRETLKGEGLIEQEDHTVTRLSRLNLEGVELKDPLHYQDRRVVAFHTKVNGGFRPGEKWEVIERQADGMFKLQREGAVKTFNPVSKGKMERLRVIGNALERSRPSADYGRVQRVGSGLQE
jgi:hypothetical protein